MKFLLDMPIPQRTVEWLRGKGFDAVHARDVDLAQSGDAEILRRAKAEGRIVLTTDLDFPHLLSILPGEDVGIILIRLHRPTPIAIQDRLKALFSTLPEGDLARSVCVIEETRIRLHRLPIK